MNVHMPIFVRQDGGVDERAVLEAVAKACAEFFIKASSDCTLAQTLRTWAEHEEMRKVCRRVKPKDWDAVVSDQVSLPGVVSSVDGAHVKVCVPTDTLPRLAKRAQIAGTQFPPDAPEFLDDCPFRHGLVIGISPHVDLSTGKLCAQVGHAVQLAVAYAKDRDPDWLDAFKRDQFPVRVVRSMLRQWDYGLFDDAEISVTDNAHTELDSPTETARAVLL